MKRFCSFAIPLVLAALLMTACGTGSAGLELDGSAWELEMLDSKPLLAGTQITLRFEGDQIQGTAGCNSYFGDYALEGDDGWTVGMLGNTEMFCMQPGGVMEQETAYLKALREADTIRLDGEELVIEDDGRARLRFRRE